MAICQQKKHIPLKGWPPSPMADSYCETCVIGVFANDISYVSVCVTVIYIIETSVCARSFVVICSLKIFFLRGIKAPECP